MESLKRLPTLLFLGVFLAYLGYQVYEFEYSDSGELQKLKGQVTQLDGQIAEMRKKKKEGEAFLKSLEAKKEEVREQARKLSGYQGALSEAADIPNLFRTLLTEARKLEIRVEKMEPGLKTQREFYLEQEFKLEVQGTFQQILLFMYRVSQMQRILRVGNFTLGPSPISISSRAVTLMAKITVNAYQYTISREDTLSKDSGSSGEGKK